MREGPFTSEDKRLLAGLSPHLTEAATLSAAVGRSAIAGMINALDLVRQPALAIDRMGHVIDANAAAHALFDDEMRIKERRLMVRDRHAGAELAALIAGGLTTEAAAGRLGVSRETARTQLKAVYAKTDTHRQSELAALLAQLG